MSQAKFSFEIEAKVLANTKELEKSLDTMKKSLQTDFSGTSNKKAIAQINDIIKAREKLEKIYSQPITSAKDADNIEKYTQQIIRGFENLGSAMQELRGKPLTWGDILKSEDKGKEVESAVKSLQALSKAESDYASNKEKIEQKIKKSSGSGLSQEQEERKKQLEQQKKTLGASKKVQLEEIKDIETYLKKMEALQQRAREAVSSGKVSSQKDFLQKKGNTGEPIKSGPNQNSFRFDNQTISFSNGSDLNNEIERVTTLKNILIELDQIQPEIPIDSDAIKRAEKELKELDNDLEEQREKLPELRVLLQKTFNIDTSNMNAEELLNIIDQLKQSAESTRFDTWEQQLPEIQQQLQQVGRDGSTAFQQIGKEAEQAQSKMDFKNRLAYFFGFDNVIRVFKQGLREAYQTVSELDESITEMAVVTDMTVGEIWGDLDFYTNSANKLGVTTKDAIDAATLYYQQGLKTVEVNQLTESTLKMARIASLDAATATDRMTNALRGFNMELNETSAEKVADVYSQLAAVSATDVDELSVAMTKTASIANSANMSFENTAAFLAQMLETTRESAETAGTALKTVIGRFTEVKELYSEGQLTGTDDEGEAIDVNKVSAALRTAGIDMNKFFVGEVGLDEIFLELAEKWDSLSIVQQRYIATQAAGSRQQSRFIAMLGDYDRLLELQSDAYNSAGASEDQFEKTQDSLESKINKLTNAWNEFLMGLANNKAIKAVVDLGTLLLKVLNKITAGTNDLTSTLLKLGTALGAIKFGKFLIGTETKIGHLSKGIIDSFAKVGTKISKFNVWDIGVKLGQNINGGIAQGMEKTQALYAGEGAIIKWFKTSLLPNLAKEFEISDFITGSLKKKIPIQDLLDTSDEALETAYLEIYGDELASIEVKEERLKQIRAEKIAQNEIIQKQNAEAIAENEIIDKQNDQLIADNGKFIISEELRAKAAEFTGGQIIATKLLEAVGYTAAQAIEIASTKSFMKVLDALRVKMIQNLSSFATYILPIILVLGSLVAVGYGIYKMINHNKEVLEELEETINNCKTAAENASESYNDILDKTTQLQALNLELNNLAQGTEEWKDKQEEVNEAVKELLDLYPQLDYEIDDNGTYVVKTSAIAQAQSAAEARKHSANAAVYQAQATEYEEKARQANNIKGQSVDASDSYLGYNYSELTDEQKYWLKNLEAAPDSIKKSLGITEDTAEETYEIAKAWAEANELIEEYNEKALEAKALAIQESAKAKGITLNYRSSEALAENSTDTIRSGSNGEKGKDGMDITGADLVAVGGSILAGVATGAAIGAAGGLGVASGPLAALGALFGGIAATVAVIHDATEEGNDTAVWGNGSNNTKETLANALTANGIGVTGKETEDLKAYAEQKLGMDPSEWEDMKDSEIDDFLGPIVAESIEAENHISNVLAMPQELKDFDLNFHVNVEDLANDDEKAIYEQIEEARKEAEAYVKDKGLSINLFSDENGEVDYNAADQFKTYMEGYKPLQEAFTNLAKTGTWSENSDTLSEINFGSAIQGFADLKDQMENGTDEMKEFAASCLILGGNLYGVNAQAKEFVNSLEAEDLASLNSASAVMELAESNKSLSTMMDNTGISASAYAEYFQKITDGTIDAETATEGYLAALAKLHAAQNTITDSLAWIENFDAGDSSTTIGTSIADWVETINELYEKGAYGDSQLINYIKAIVGEETWEKALSDADGNLKDAEESLLGTVNSFGDSFYNAWVNFANKSESANVLADGSIQLDFTKFDDTDALIQELQDTLGVSKEIAESMIAEIITYSEDLTDEFNHSDMENSIDTWLNGAITELKDKKYILHSDLQELADLIGTDVETVENAINTSGDGITIIDDSKGYESVKDLIFKDKNGNAITDNSEIDLTDTYETLIKFGYDDTEAKSIITQLAKDANSKFSGLTFGWDDETYERAAEETEEEYNTRIANGVAAGLSSTTVTDAEEAAAIKARKIYGKQIVKGIYGALKKVAEQISGNLSNFDSKLGKKLGQGIIDVINSLDQDEIIEGVTATDSEDEETEDKVKTREANTATYNTTETLSKTINGTTEDGTGSGYNTDGSKTTEDDDDEDTWENDREWLHNLLEEIEANTRELTQIEADYTDMQEDAENYNVADFVKNIEDTMSALTYKQAAATVERDQSKARIEEWLGQNEWAKDFISFDEKGYVNENYYALEELETRDPTMGEAATELLSEIEPYLDYYNTSQETLEQIDDEVRACKKKIVDTVISFKNRVVESLKTYYQNQINEQQTIADTIKESNDDLIDSINEAIEKERQEKENADTVEDITDKQQRLAYLKLDTSGAHQAEIMQLEKEIGEDQEDYTNTLIDQKINELKDQNDKADEQRQQQIDLLEDQLQWDEDTGKLMAEAEALIKQDVDAVTGKIASGSMLESILKGNDGWTKMSEEEQEEWAGELNSQTLTIAGYDEYMQKHQNETGFKIDDTELQADIESLKSLLSEVATGVYDKLAELEKKVESNNNNNNGGTPTGDTKTPKFSVGDKVNIVTDGDSDLYYKNGTLSESNVAGTTTGREIVSYDSSTGLYGIKAGTEKEREKYGDIYYVKEEDLEKYIASNNTDDDDDDTEPSWHDGSSSGWREEEIASGTPIKPREGANWHAYKTTTFMYDKKYAWLGEGEEAGWNWDNAKTTGDYIYGVYGLAVKVSGLTLEDGTTASRWVYVGDMQFKYQDGGLADFTGPAWLDGTKSRPEMVLNSTDTENFIALKDILASLMKGGITNTKNTVQDMYNTFNIQVDEIADDYDVDQLVDRVKQDLYNIGSYRNVNQVNRLR